MRPANVLKTGRGGMRSAKNPEKVMTVMEHIAELRNGVLISLLAFLVLTIVSFIFSNTIIAIFTKPFASVQSSVDKKLVVTNIIEGFSTQIQVSVISGLILSLPVHIFSFLKFVFPGLERKHKRIILIFLIASFVLIVIGAYIAYFQVVPLAINFLTSSAFIPKGVGYLLNYSQNIFYVFSFILWSLAALQTPLILELLLIFNILSRKQVFHASRYIIVGIFVVAAIITPPDFISQLGVALPLTLLFFVALLVAKIFKFGEG